MNRGSPLGTEQYSTSRLRKIAFSLVVLFILFATLEGIARFTHVDPLTDNKLGMHLVPHPTRIWWMEPGSLNAFGVTFTVNSDGRRTTPEALKDRRSKTGDRLRVLTLGDSSIVGHGLPDTHTPHRQLEANFARVGMDIEVLSGATPGYSTAQSLVFLDEVGWDLEPDLLMVGNMWSDNNLRPPLWLDHQLVPWHRTDRDWLDELKRRRFRSLLSRHSRAINWLFQALGNNDSEFFQVSWQQTEIMDEGFRRVPLKEYAQNLDRITQQAAERDAGVIFLAPCNRILLERANKQQDTSWAPYFRAMRKISELRKVPMVIGCEALLEAGLNSSSAFIDEMHPSAIANQAYGYALVQELLKNDWPQNRLNATQTDASPVGRFRDRWAKEADPTYDTIQPTADDYFARTERTLMLEPGQFVPPTTLATKPSEAEIAEMKQRLKYFEFGRTLPLPPLLVQETEDGRYLILQGAALWAVAMRAGWPQIPADLAD